ncbi:hypothetical protein Pan97_13010 [Bremerella volcania]|uniref:Uncharacterized protein n=1 Tax=Bremerella volcania TaxID=2527984 RepID=A0A518C526_9BACT|nr:hypothetical protein [Bremerella volcania]QDU74294.1 hypothetical protein Pan97_13010 [Bremerella volcania]
MTTQETNPFASPMTESKRESVQLAAMPPTTPLDEGSWPYQATELAEIEEIPRPWGRPVSVARKWGNGRWLGVFLSGLALAYFTFAIGVSVISELDIAESSTAVRMMSAALIIILVLSVPHAIYYLREDVSDIRNLKKLIRRRRQAIDPLPESEEPVYVVVVPRTRWVFSRNEMTAYVAFAHIDLQAKQILLDADQFRFRIPVNSLLDISVEPLLKYRTTYWFVRLVLQTQTGPQELCFRLGNTNRLWQTNSQREADAEEYKKRILLLKNST